MVSGPGLTVAQAYSIDTKTDDGLPQSGRATAMFNGWGGIIWAGASDTSATPGAAATCYDNGNSAGATQQYSLAQNSSSMNCALSFRFQ